MLCTGMVIILQSRLTGKRSMSYLDDDSDDGGGDEVSFSGISRSKKTKISDTTFDMVDVSPIYAGILKAYVILWPFPKDITDQC